MWYEYNIIQFYIKKQIYISCHTFTGMCITEGLFCVQAYTDVTSIGRGRVAASPSPLVMPTPTAGWALGPGCPTRPGPTYWNTHIRNVIYVIHNVDILVLQLDQTSKNGPVTWARLRVTVLILHWGSYAGTWVGPPLCCGAATFPGSEASGTLLGTAGPCFPGSPAGTLGLGRSSATCLYQVFNQSLKTQKTWFS